MDGSPPGSLSLGFSRQEYWSGLPFPSPMHESEKWKWSCSVVLSDPMGCSPPGSSLHGIFQARVLAWGAIAFSNDKLREHIKKQRHYFANKSPSSQSYGFSSSHVWMWELDHKEGWALKDWCFWTVLLEKTLESPWTARRSNQSIVKKINPEYLLEGLMLKLMLQYFGHLMWRADSLEKTLMVGKIEGKRRRGWQRTRRLDSIIDSMDINLSKLWAAQKDRGASVLQSTGWQRVGHD